MYAIEKLRIELKFIKGDVLTYKIYNLFIINEFIENCFPQENELMEGQVSRF